MGTGIHHNRMGTLLAEEKTPIKYLGPALTQGETKTAGGLKRETLYFSEVDQSCRRLNSREWLLFS